MSAPLAVGDYVYTSWGYDQTNVSFYKVMALTPTGKSARVQSWTASDVATAENMHRSLVPGDVCATVWDDSDVPEGADYWDRQQYRKAVDAPVQTVRILNQHGTVKVDGHHAWKWDGKPQYATGHGYGH